MMYWLMDSNLNVVILHFRNQYHFCGWLNYSTKNMCYQDKIRNMSKLYPTPAVRLMYFWKECVSVV